MFSLRYRYQTIELNGIDIHLRTLRDRQQYNDIDGVAEKLGISPASWPLFGVVWPSGEILARLMLDYEIEGKRILEVVCGIALASLVLSKRLADITATDHHPEVENFLLENIKLNDGNDIPFVRTGWGEKESSLGKFDLIIGSDLLYERDHVDLLAGFIDRHASQHCNIIVTDPGRGLHPRFSKKMVSLGYTHNQSKPVSIDFLEQPFRGQILRYAR